ncbi:hypothetical protein [Magnetococcus sp. PR-3]|uniref:hypothetical protein n=1 Tax=Magnetococcus sp. PR-3 TaxID=3120355 RepID=UPI002FCDED3A
MTTPYACWSCKHSLEAEDFKRGAYCDRCGRDLRCCMACHFYAVEAYNACHETQAERVVDKEKSNFCDFFKPRPAQGSKGAMGHRQGVAKDAALDAAEALFKK